MSVEIDAYRANPLWAEIDFVLDAVSLKSAHDDADRARQRRASTVMNYAKSFRATEVTLLVSAWPTILSNLSTYFSETGRQISGWDDAGAMPGSTIVALDQNLDAALESLRLLPHPERNDANRALLDALQGRDDAAQAELAALSQRVADLLAVLDSYKELAQTTSEELASKEAETEAHGVRVQTELQEALQSGSDAVTALTTFGNGQFADAMRQLGTDTQRVVEEIDQRAEQAKRLITLIGGTGVSDGYTTYANQQRKAAFWWSIAAVALGIAAVIYIAVALWDLRLTTDPSAASVILKSAVSATGLTVAGYMTRLAANHREQAVKARFRALDMLALGPFAEDLSEEQQRALKFAVGVASFGQDVSESDKIAMIDRLRKPAEL